MKNEHLVPVAIRDICEKIDSSIVRPHEKMYHIQRLETIRDYCDLVIKKNQNIYKSRIS